MTVVVVVLGPHKFVIELGRTNYCFWRQVQTSPTKTVSRLLSLLVSFDILLLQSKDCAPINHHQDLAEDRPVPGSRTCTPDHEVSLVRSAHPPSAPDEITMAASREGCPSNKRLFLCLSSDASDHVIELSINELRVRQTGCSK